MVSHNELERTIRYVLIRVECVERTDYNFNNLNNNENQQSSSSSSTLMKRYSHNELTDEIDALNHVRMNLNKFINNNQDLNVEQLCVLKELKHRLFGAIEKLERAKQNLISNVVVKNHPLTNDVMKSPKKNSNNKNQNNQNQNRNNKKSNKFNNNQLNKNQSIEPFGGADCSTLIRFFVNQINKNPEICQNNENEQSLATSSSFSSPFGPNPSP